MGDQLNVNIDRLIALIKDRAMIWDKTSETYKMRHLKTAAWHEICSILIDNFETLTLLEQNEKGKELIKIWTMERDKWMKWRRRLRDQKSGLGTNKIKKIPYSDRLQFLEKIVKPNICRTSSSDADIEERQQDNNTQTLTPEIVITESMDSRINLNKSQRYARPAKKKRPSDEFEIGVVNAVKTTSVAQPSAIESPLLSFFKSIVPAVEEFNTDERIKFQIQVLNLIQSMKREQSGSRNNP